MRLIVPLIASLALAGCVYKIDVQQGNYVTQDVAAKVKNGMTKAEVRQLLGTPLLADAFHANRWDYYFSNVKGRAREDRSRLTILFQEDKVVSVTGEARPAAAPPVGAATPPEAPKAAAPPAPPATK
jgi:outer membrane protein assembly factor BamE